MNVLFLSLPIVERDLDRSKSYVRANMPYGILSIASYVEKYSKKVESIKILDLNVKSSYEYYMHPEALLEYLETNDFDVIGISAMFNAGLGYLQEYADVIKKYDENIFVFAGGISASNQYKKVLKHVKNIDAVCIGEGEIPVLDLLEHELDERILHEHPAWITAKDVDTKMVSSVFVENLDEIPPIKYEYLKIDEYETRGFSKKPLPAFPMHFTRGCPFNCIFCCAANNHGKKIRSMSAARFIDDVKRMVEKYGAKVIDIDDDQVLLYQDRAKEILRGIKDLDVRLEFASGLSVRYIDEELAELMAECGVKEIFLAVESGSERMLKEVIDKPLRLEEIKPVVDALRKFNIVVKAFFVIGIPGETPDDREKTLNFIKETGFDWSFISIALPFIGSRLYDVCIENNYIQEEEYAEKTLVPEVGLIKAPYIEPNEMEEIAYSMNLEVNFVENYTYKIGNYEEAERQFERVCTRFPEQAFAHYFLAKTMEKLGRNHELIEEHYDRFNKIVNSNKQWHEYAKKYKLI